MGKHGAALRGGRGSLVQVYGCLGQVYGCLVQVYGCFLRHLPPLFSTLSSVNVYYFQTQSRCRIKPVVHVKRRGVLSQTSEAGCPVLQKSGSGETEVEVMSYAEEQELEVLDDFVF